MKMFVYSGEVKLCECGRDAEIKDIDEDDLFTGDIVMIYTVDKDGVLGYVGGMTAVVSSDYFGYAGEIAKIKDALEKPFIMGLKSVIFEKDWNGWAIKRVKSYKDVIDGEHWTNYGFSFRKEGDTQ